MLPTHPSDDQILAAVRNWIDALAANDYESALAGTKPDRYYKWTPALLRDVVSAYGPSAKATERREWKVTSRTLAVGAPFVRIERESVPPGAEAHIEHSLPLNGQWSDLTATFRVETRDGRASLILEEVRVL